MHGTAAKHFSSEGPSYGNDWGPRIVHVDVDAFFASVEQVLDPKLHGRPVLVGRGVVASASYEAKLLGVRTAMSFREALRICPQALVVPGQYEHYAEFAARVRRVLERFTPAVETAALDDFYLDFAGTERLHADLRATLERLQQEVAEETGLNVSVGAATTKAVASIASRLERPRGFRIEFSHKVHSGSIDTRSFQALVVFHPDNESEPRHMQIAPARVEREQDETTWARLHIDHGYARRHLDGRSFDLFLILKCDVIRDRHGHAVDGNFIAHRLPTGDNIQGGTFESWVRVRMRSQNA